MAERALVGVTGSSRRWSPSWWATRSALWLAGARPERISVRHTPRRRDFAALVIGGGEDISPQHYGGDLHERVRFDPARDELEMRWIRWALDKRVPLLGICRGAQLINVVLGGDLYQDVRHMRELTHNRPGLLPTKHVDLDPGSALAAICRCHSLRVNSLHHQAVRNCGHHLDVVGRDLDHIVQAFEHTGGQRIIGVQWHPEYLFYLPAQLRIFRWLVEHASA